MGLFSGLATLPLAPVRGAAWVAQQVADEADRQLYDEDQIRREMLQLEIDHDEGKIGDEERAVMEDALLERLEIAREREREERVEAEERGELEPPSGSVLEAEHLDDLGRPAEGDFDRSPDDPPPDHEER